MEALALAESQHGLLAPWQLADLGCRSAIRWARRSGSLVAVRPGVVALGHRSRTREAAWMAAVLAAGPGALLSHQSAAELWGLLRRAGRHHVTTGRDVRRLDHDLVVHRSRAGRFDRTVREGIPVTGLGRTLVDLCDVLEPAALAAAVERVHHLDVRMMRRCLARHPGRRAAGVLGRLLDAYDAQTRSWLERVFLRLCREHGIPKPLVNVVVAGRERDFVWPGERLVIEVDGDAFHAPRARRNDDARRDVAAGVEGWRPHRLTYEQVVLDPSGAAAAVQALRAAGG